MLNAPVAQRIEHRIPNPGVAGSTPARRVFILRTTGMAKFLLWFILLFLCWPLALLAIILYPIIWLLSLPFRLVGITVSAVFDLLKAIITLPARILRGI